MVGDRHMVPRGGFFSTGRKDIIKPGVATKPHTRRYTYYMWFENDARATQHKGHLQERDKHYVTAEEGTRHWKVSGEFEARFHKLETIAGVRAQPKPLAEKTIVKEKTQRVRKKVAKEVLDAPTEVGTWDGDAEDDEHADGPDVGDEGDEDDALEQAMGRLKWEDVGRALTDQRAATGSMPESIIPALNLANFRDESWLNWFLHWMPIKTIALIAEATNKTAKDIAWSSFKTSLPWKKLTTGEFLRWLGVWVLMTVYPVAGTSRRTHALARCP